MDAVELHDEAGTEWRIVSPSGQEFVVPASEVHIQRLCVTVADCAEPSMLRVETEDRWTFSAVVQDQ